MLRYMNITLFLEQTKTLFCCVANLPHLACIGLPLIIAVWLSGLKCAALVFSRPHLYGWRATPSWEPDASQGGGGTDGVGLFILKMFRQRAEAITGPLISHALPDRNGSLHPRWLRRASQ